ncbi:MAG TPA: cupin domain-containing protein [Steroidobacteraceae bacterium]|nr:cupin domain-containing protein [Steroidobacteraceae bacterium]
MQRSSIFVVAAAASVAGAVSFAAMAADAPAKGAPTIVLVGAKKAPNLPDAEHDWADGALKIERLIKASPAFASVKANVKVFPVGFPKDAAELGDASVVVLYFGTQRGASGSANPLQDPAAKQALGALMAKGVGLVALHQSFTVADQNSGVPFKEWLGAERIAVTDYTFEDAPIAIPAKGHPIVSGVQAFDALDEYYPTVEFAAGAKTTPILTARLHVQHKRSGAVFEEPPKDRVVAWAYERANGGRSFGFSGGHYLASFDQPQVRTTLLNAILWAAHAAVPASGATVSPPPPQRVVLKKSEVEVLPQPWGKLEWYVSRPIGNSATMTVGQATISPGKFNPPHWHPNCDEILHVVQGHIMHRVGDREYEMRAGDTVVIPEGTVHNARNIGTEDAVLMVSFNSADRVAIGE